MKEVKSIRLGQKEGTFAKKEQLVLDLVRVNERSEIQTHEPMKAVKSNLHESMKEVKSNLHESMEAMKSTRR